MPPNYPVHHLFSSHSVFFRIISWCKYIISWKLATMQQEKKTEPNSENLHKLFFARSFKSCLNNALLTEIIYFFSFCAELIFIFEKMMSIIQIKRTKKGQCKKGTFVVKQIQLESESGKKPNASWRKQQKQQWTYRSWYGRTSWPLQSNEYAC